MLLLLGLSACASARPEPPAPVAPPLEEQDGFAAGITPLTAEQAAEAEKLEKRKPAG